MISQAVRSKILRLLGLEKSDSLKDQENDYKRKGKQQTANEYKNVQLKMKREYAMHLNESS